MDYKTKYLRYKQKYLNLRKNIQVGSAKADLVYEVTNTMSFYFLADPSTRESLKDLIGNILDSNKITTYLSTGTTKVVFESVNRPNEVFKIVINNKNLVNRLIMEPLSMIEYKQYCVTPRDITIYINSKYKKIDSCPINVIINDNIGDSIIITWWEPKAEYAGFKTFPEEHKNEQLQHFIEKSTKELESKGFNDLGTVNIGLFREGDSLIFKWFDIQPTQGIKYNCITIN